MSMKLASRLSAALALAIAASGLESCSTGVPGIPGTSSPLYPSVSGNWQIQSGSGNTTVLPATILLFTGALSSSGSAVTGVGTISELNSSAANPVAPCLLNVPVTLTGTVDVLGNLSLTSSSLNGGTATIQLLTPASTGFAAGTIALTGGSCALLSGPALGLLVPSVSGSYVGTVNALSTATNNIPSGSLQLALTQSAANATGGFPVTGTATFTSTSPACTVTSSLSGTVSGVGFQLQTAGTSQFALPAMSLVGATGSPAANSPIATTLLINTGSCSFNSFQGTLTR